jgi:hypothetical protein
MNDDKKFLKLVLNSLQVELEEIQSLMKTDLMEKFFSQM